MDGERRGIDWRHSNRPWFISATILAVLAVVALTALGRPLLGLAVGGAIAVWPLWTWLGSRTMQGMEQTFDTQIAARERRSRRKPRI